MVWCKDCGCQVERDPTVHAARYGADPAAPRGAAAPPPEQVPDPLHMLMLAGIQSIGDEPRTEREQDKSSCSCAMASLPGKSIFWPALSSSVPYSAPTSLLVRIEREYETRRSGE